MIMLYESEDGHVRESIWNSRDGVTPFGVIGKDGKTDLIHKQWHKDILDPNHTPMPGDRVFVDWSKDEAREYYQRMVEERWDDEQYPLNRFGEPKEVVLEMLLRDGWREGQPCLREVASEGWPNLKKPELF